VALSISKPYPISVDILRATNCLCLSKPAGVTDTLTKAGFRPAGRVGPVGLNMGGGLTFLRAFAVAFPVGTRAAPAVYCIEY
jgi:hypothetical protein